MARASSCNETKQFFRQNNLRRKRDAMGATSSLGLPVKNILHTTNVVQRTHGANDGS
jgi:hypothetical protein